MVSPLAPRFLGKNLNLKTVIRFFCWGKVGMVAFAAYSFLPRTGDTGLSSINFAETILVSAV